MTSNVALIVGAGRGRRMGGPIPKQYRLLDGIPILRHTTIAFLRHPEINTVQAVIHPSDRTLYAEATEGLDLPPPVIGGETRQESVRLGLEAVAGLHPAKVVIHDAVRPFVDAETISLVLQALDTAPAVIAALPVPDTLKRCKDGAIQATLDRTGVWRAQTPQGFQFDKILEAHRQVHRRDPTHPELTDDSLVAEKYGLAVSVVYGGDDNFKITTEQDLARAEQILQRGRLEWHTGWGFDVHPFGAGDHVMLCGIPVPHVQGIDREQNPDVPLNAVTDALLGTIGGVNAGSHFRPDMPTWRGVTSELFVRHAVSLVTMKGGRIIHVDVSIIADAPDIAPWRDRMVERLAALLSVPADRVSVKRSTSMGVGPIGRREGLAAQCLVTVQYPALSGGPGGTQAA
jgi:2-C-methyl-D-erythritol 4-phosphate cytidylyltransferase/2-C-methyl-D-erythritol 2,4-cyclodiphosphate synthase